MVVPRQDPLTGDLPWDSPSWFPSMCSSFQDTTPESMGQPCVGVKRHDEMSRMPAVSPARARSGRRFAQEPEDLRPEVDESGRAAGTR